MITRWRVGTLSMAVSLIGSQINATLVVPQELSVVYNGKSM